MKALGIGRRFARAPCGQAARWRRWKPRQELPSGPRECTAVLTLPTFFAAVRCATLSRQQCQAFIRS